MKVKDIGELRLIKDVIFPELDRIHSNRNVIIDRGDDAACVRLKKLAILTTDTFIEKVHFDPTYFTFSEIGYRTLVAALSDIAAMGGSPKFALVSIQIPPNLNANSVKELYSGMIRISKKFKLKIIGGDTVSSKTLGITVTIIGEGDRIVKRSGARLNDSIFVTGELGSSSFGLYLLNKSKFSSKDSYLIKRHKMPIPRIVEGKILAKSINSMIDLSDGLSTDLHHIIEESKVGAVIYKEKIPLHRSLKKIARRGNRDPYDFALYGGEDYELLFTAPRKKGSMISKKVKDKTGIKVTEIGIIFKKEEGVWLEADGKRIPLNPLGYDHFQHKLSTFQA